MNSYELAIVLTSLVGDSLSVIGGVLVLCVIALLSFLLDYKVFGNDLRSLIIVCLMVSDTANSLTNLISGLSVLRGNQLTNGPFCTATGYIGQVSVQSSDFSVLLMALITYATFTPDPGSPSSRWLARLQARKWVLVLPLLLVPLASASLAFVYPGYERASFSWCWIAAEPVYARYVYAHGLRLAIMLALPVIYGRLYFRIRNAYRVAKERDLARRAIEAEWEYSMTPPRSMNKHSYGGRPDSIISLASHDTVILDGDDVSSYFESVRGPTSLKCVAGARRRKRGASASPEVAKLKQLKKAMDLMIALPIVYFILWIPGVINRLHVATNGRTTWVLEALQTSTQYIGFVNSILYGLNPNVQSGLAELWADLWD
ncbi:hypothetical protein SeMB42_g03752 [Synchytrium endobioticum]|uniref:G-protein coupled receptors family 1 profile domain-containing protein n=1 Tax=Synchytrium endobioticum TaxID=286115 RepID=A0A507D4A0_9FUNG|nr:hypothetical protein SeLEV6574_g05729 [Synchytrium endobioticum]TPX46303.1 hypothetical protein SeMB42_g03752 [Synchytrium endobioticum]